MLCFSASKYTNLLYTCNALENNHGDSPEIFVVPILIIDIFKHTVNFNVFLYQVFFRESVGLRCTKHFADNVNDQLKCLGITGKDQTAFLNAIFGYVEDDVYHEGLVNSTDDALFDAALASLEEEWNKKELELNPSSDEAKFYSWMKKRSTMFKESLTDAARVKAGLQPGEKLTTNAAESANHILKEAAEYEQMSLPEFIALAKSITNSQHQGVIRAVIRKDQYRFQSQYSFLEIEEDCWMYDMSPSDRERHIRNVFSAEVGASEMSKGASTKGSRAVVDPANGNLTTPQLSVPYTSVNLPIAQSVLSAIWNKGKWYALR